MAQTLKVEVEIPDWVNWIAVDKNGFGHGYRREPKQGINEWDIPPFPRADMFKPRFTLLFKGPKPKNWKNELYTWR